MYGADVEVAGPGIVIATGRRAMPKAGSLPGRGDLTGGVGCHSFIPSLPYSGWVTWTVLFGVY